MFDEITQGMLNQLILIEKALGRKLTDEDEVHELASGIFYINPDEIVEIEDNESRKVSYFTLPQELQHDIWLNYGQD
jgi:hypothetical protein